ncbi:MAG TPA: phosphatase PAP2 family protein, partial [Solirubrobacteraceae bacterium]|nr:phosphatase PAP2 family protein [Solirubrobacteraceae bacterium]
MSGHAYTAKTMRPHALAPRVERSGVAIALALAGMCALALAAVWALAALVPSARLKDSVVLYHFTLLSRPRVDGPALFLLHLLSPSLFVLWAVALMALALARERPRVAVAVAAIMGLAPLTSEQLKPLLAHQHAQVGGVVVGAASWPSGHATAAAALVLAAVLVAPARLRKLVSSVGAVFVLAVGCALLILAWHMPSDVLGGYLVAALWAALALAALRALDRRWPAP